MEVLSVFHRMVIPKSCNYKDREWGVHFWQVGLRTSAFWFLWLSVIESVWRATAIRYFVNACHYKGWFLSHKSSYIQGVAITVIITTIIVSIIIYMSWSSACFKVTGTLRLAGGSLRFWIELHLPKAIDIYMVDVCVHLTQCSAKVIWFNIINNWRVSVSQSLKGKKITLCASGPHLCSEVGSIPSLNPICPYGW